MKFMKFNKNNSSKKFTKIISVILCCAILMTAGISIHSSADNGNKESTQVSGIYTAFRSLFDRIVSLFSGKCPQENESENIKNPAGNINQNNTNSSNKGDKTENKAQNKADKTENKTDNNSVKEEPKKETVKENNKDKNENQTVIKEDTVHKTENSTQNSKDKRSQFESEVVRLVNVERAKYGLSALQMNYSLVDLSRQKSQDMHDLKYFAHQSPTYGSAFDMMKKAGVSYRTAGENIAMGYSTPEAVVNAWMNSEGHRANILSSKYTQIGVGYVEDGHYWTQMFIG